MNEHKKASHAAFLALSLWGEESQVGWIAQELRADLEYTQKYGGTPSRDEAIQSRFATLNQAIHRGWVEAMMRLADKLPTGRIDARAAEKMERGNFRNASPSATLSAAHLKRATWPTTPRNS